jgi:hypothetical protein
MNKTIRTYLLKHLAPVLSQRFNIDLVEVKDVINTFDQEVDQEVPMATTPPSPKKKPRTSVTPKKVPTKDDLLKEAKALGLKVTTKMRKAEIQNMLDAANPQMTPPRSRTPSPEPKAKPVAKKPAKATKPAKVAVVKPLEKDDKDRKVGSLEGKSFKTIKNESWTFGKLLGTGGYGAVYEVKDNPNLVIKTGSDTLKKDQDSGVFLEKAVYLKLKDPEGDKHGIPQIVDSGKLPKDIRPNDYFIVMPRFETSLYDLSNDILTPQEQKKVINDMLDALKHLSKKGYLHLDIKAENIMRKNDRWFLIDYGIAERFNDKTETTIDPKKAGNGTAWFMARDAHKGIMSRKADLESLVYTIVEMYGYILPWHREKRKGEKDKDYLQYMLESKQKFFKTYKDLKFPQYYNTFIEYVDKLQPGTEPNYDVLKL